MATAALNASLPTGETYSELQMAFDYYNEALFEGALPPCLITLQRKKRTYGYFSSERFVHRGSKTMTDEIAMNPSYFAAAPVREILQTLVHEMCHSWQYHYGSPGRRGYHNTEWADKMEAIGLMPSNTAKPGGNRTGEKMCDYVIEDGPFMAATKTLLDREFNISWLDRFPAADPRPDPSDPAGSPGPADTTTQEGTRDTDLDSLIAPPNETKNRSNRVKFRCPSCGAQAWGKPSLRLLCGSDDCHAAPFDPVT